MPHAHVTLRSAILLLTQTPVCLSQKTLAFPCLRPTVDGDAKVLPTCLLLTSALAFKSFAFLCLGRCYIEIGLLVGYLKAK